MRKMFASLSDFVLNAQILVYKCIELVLRIVQQYNLIKYTCFD